MKNSVLKFSLLGTVVLALVAVGSYFLQKRPGSGEQAALNHPYLEKIDVANYTFQINAVHYSENGKRSVLYDFQADLTHFKQKINETVSQWTAIRRLELGDTVMEASINDLLINKTFVARQQNSELNIFADEAIPDELRPSQLYFMSVINLPLTSFDQPSELRVESDGSSKFNVRYEVEKSPQGFKVRRVWLQTINSPYEIHPSTNSFVYLYDTQGRLKSINGQTIFVRRGSKDRIETTVSLELASNQAPLAAIKRVDTTSLTSLDSSGSAIATLGDVKTQAELFKELDAFTTKASAKQDQALFAQLTADLHANPSHMRPLIDKLLSITDRDNDSKVRMTMLFTVLADSDTPEGSKALSHLASTECPDSFCKSQALMAHTFHSTPTVESAQEVLNVARTATDEEVYASAYRSAGAAGSKLSSSYAALKNELLEDYQGASEPSKKRAVVGAMGNHAQVEYLPAILENQKSDDDFMREGAVYALRNIQSDKVNSALLSGFEAEKERHVVNGYVRTLQNRSLLADDWKRIANRALKEEDDDGLQIDIAVLMADAYSQNDPDARTELESLREKTKFPEVKQVIEEELRKAEDTIARRKVDEESMGTESQESE